MVEVICVLGPVWTVVCVMVGYQVGVRGGRSIGWMDEVGRAAGRMVRGEEESSSRGEGKVKDEGKRMKV